MNFSIIYILKYYLLVGITYLEREWNETHLIYIVWL